MAYSKLNSELRKVSAAKRFKWEVFSAFFQGTHLTEHVKGLEPVELALVVLVEEATKRASPELNCGRHFNGFDALLGHDPHKTWTREISKAERQTQGIKGCRAFRMRPISSIGTHGVEEAERLGSGTTKHASVTSEP